MARNKETEVTSEEGTPVEPVANEETPAAEGADAPGNNNKGKKAAKPEGWVSPVAFNKLMNEKFGLENPPQSMYGLLKSIKDENILTTNQADGHQMVNVEAGTTWFEGQLAKRAERKAKKASKAEAAATETPAE